MPTPREHVCVTSKNESMNYLNRGDPKKLEKTTKSSKVREGRWPLSGCVQCMLEHVGTAGTAPQAGELSFFSQFSFLDLIDYIHNQGINQKQFFKNLEIRLLINYLYFYYYYIS